MKTMQVCGLAVVLAMAAAATAQEAGHGAELPPFSSLDADANGYITESEASQTPAVTEVFAELDANKDEQLDEQEYGKIAEIR
jgi:hypothetical protein